VKPLFRCRRRCFSALNAYSSFGALPPSIIPFSPLRGYRFLACACIRGGNAGAARAIPRRSLDAVCNRGLVHSRSLHLCEGVLYGSVRRWPVMAALCLPFPPPLFLRSLRRLSSFRLSVNLRRGRIGGPSVFHGSFFVFILPLKICRACRERMPLFSPRVDFPFFREPSPLCLQNWF